jgi:hypothetical protein
MGGSIQLPTPGSVRLPRGWVSSVADPGQLGCRITLTAKQFGELSPLAFIERKENVILLGPSGLGKTPPDDRPGAEGLHERLHSVLHQLLGSSRTPAALPGPGAG